MGIKPSHYERRLQIKHFFDDRQTGQTRRTWLELQLAPPERSAEGCRQLLQTWTILDIFEYDLIYSNHETSS